MKINEIREYLTEISPQWMLEDETEDWTVERQISDEHPRCVDFCQPPWAVGGGIYADIYPVVDGETVSYIPLHLIPEWFPEEVSK